MRARTSPTVRLYRGSQEIIFRPPAESSGLKLAGPAAQSRMLHDRSSGVRANILTYSARDLPQGTTRSSLGTALLLALVGGERHVEATDLAGRPVGVNYALGCGLVVLSLGLVAQVSGPLLISGLEGRAEGL